MKLNCLFILSFLTFLSTSSITFDSGFLSLSVYAQENNDSPQTLEEAEEIYSRLPVLRMGKGNFFQLNRYHPNYIETVLKAIEDLEKILPIYQKYGQKEDENYAMSQLCNYALEVGLFVNIAEKTFKYCSQQSTSVPLMYTISLIEQYKSLGKYSEAVDFLQEQIRFSHETEFNWRTARPLREIADLYLMLGDLKQSNYNYKKLALTYFRTEKNTDVYKKKEIPVEESEINISIAIASLGIENTDKIEKILYQSLDDYYLPIEPMMEPGETYYNAYNTLLKIFILQGKYEKLLMFSESKVPSKISEHKNKNNEYKKLFGEDRLKLPELTIDQIKDFAENKNITIVKYFLFDNKKKHDFILQRSKIAILVIKPNRKIYLRVLDLSKPYLIAYRKLNIRIKDLTSIIYSFVFFSVSAYCFTRNKSPLLIVFIISSIIWFILFLLFSEENKTILLKTYKLNTITSKSSLFLPNLTHAILTQINNKNNALKKTLQEKYCQTSDICLQKLNQILIKPIADLLPQNPEENVIFIPQEYLFKIPFAALKDDKGKYLIEKHTIHIASSIRLLKFAQMQQFKRFSTSSNQVLIIGNPTMPRVANESVWNYRIREPVYEQLDPLPGAEEEAKKIARIWQTEPLIGNQANELAFVQQASEAKIIHLATHGIYPMGIFSSPFLALAPSRQKEKHKQSGINFGDGQLDGNEIENIDLNAELVVLSACNTALSPLYSSIGLAQPFLARGVPSVVVSLWQVPDAPTSELMVDFYNNLKSTPDKAQALRQAMLATKEKYPEPVNWAAFTLVGEK